MAKKKVDPPWNLEPGMVKRSAKKSVKERNREIRGNVKILKVYEEAHRRAKFSAFQDGMKLVDYIELLINRDWEERNGK